MELKSWLAATSLSFCRKTVYLPLMNKKYKSIVSIFSSKHTKGKTRKQGLKASSRPLYELFFIIIVRGNPTPTNARLRQ